MSILLESRKIFVPLSLQTDTVRLVQLVEHQIVVLGVVGSSPTSHPKTKENDFDVVLFLFPPVRRGQGEEGFECRGTRDQGVVFGTGEGLLVYGIDARC